MEPNKSLTDKEDIVPIQYDKKLRPPDPGDEAAEFIAWLKKRSAVQYLSTCIRKWSREGIDVENIIKVLGKDFLRIYTNRSEKVVYLEDKPWADQWLIHYGREVPHHGQPLRLKK